MNQYRSNRPIDRAIDDAFELVLWVLFLGLVAVIMIFSVLGDVFRYGLTWGEFWGLLQVGFWVAVGVLVVVGRRRGRAMQRAQASAHEQAVHRAYRTAFMRKMAEVATADELRRLDTLWSPGEWSYQDQDFHSHLMRRWCLAHPARYPSQDQLRQRGFMCDCESAAGHSCRPEDAAMQLADQAPASELPLMTWARCAWSRRRQPAATR